MADKQTIDALIDAIQMEHQGTPPANPGAGLSRFFLDAAGVGQLRRTNGDIDPIAGAGGNNVELICVVQLDATQNVTADVWTPIEFNSILFDNGWWNQPNFEVDIGADGVYLIHTRLRVDYGSAYPLLRVYVNDVKQGMSFSRSLSAGGWSRVKETFVLPLEDIDTLQVYGIQSGDTEFSYLEKWEAQLVLCRLD